MKAAFTPHFQRSYQKLPPSIQATFDKQATLLLKDLRHPSLRAKKYDEKRDIWQVRVTGSYRCYFEIKGDYYIFHEVRLHKD